MTPDNLMLRACSIGGSTRSGRNILATLGVEVTTDAPCDNFVLEFSGEAGGTRHRYLINRWWVVDNYKKGEVPRH